MFTKNYVVSKIDGDYAILIDENNEEISIARALLPDGISDGMKIKMENFEYNIVK